MLRNASILVGGLLLGAASAAVFVHPALLGGTQAKAAVQASYNPLLLFGEIFEAVRSDYVDPTDDTKLVEAAVDAMLVSLDPHSNYMAPKSFRDMQVQTRGEFGGLGIEVTMEEGLVKVNNPNEDGPAFRAGVKPGDFITEVDGTAILGLTLNQAVEKMRGAVGTPVAIKIKRGGSDAPLEFKIVREIIPIVSVRSRVETDVGYIKIDQFTEKTFDGLKKEMAKIKAAIPPDRFRGYVVDLRNNPGGLVDQAVRVVDSFLDRGEIVSIRGRKGGDVQRYDAQAGDLADGRPVIVLINGASASASEIVAGALQDHHRATVLGTRSFGKGSVQTIVPLGQNNGGLRLTTARYYTPAGRSIQALGIDPDIEVWVDVPPELAALAQSRGEAGLRGHLANANAAAERAASSVYVPRDTSKDNQLIIAYDLLRGLRTNPAFLPGTGPANP
ncbi:MAG: S41 family peptidase [Bauldia sp.]